MPRGHTDHIHWSIGGGSGVELVCFPFYACLQLLTSREIIPILESPRFLRTPQVDVT
jgi:hypothetical protein